MPSHKHSCLTEPNSDDGIYRIRKALDQAHLLTSRDVILFAREAPPSRVSFCSIPSHHSC